MNRGVLGRQRVWTSRPPSDSIESSRTNALPHSEHVSRCCRSMNPFESSSRPVRDARWAERLGVSSNRTETRNQILTGYQREDMTCDRGKSITRRGTGVPLRGGLAGPGAGPYEALALRFGRRVSRMTLTSGLALVICRSSRSWRRSALASTFRKRVRTAPGSRGEKNDFGLRPITVPDRDTTGPSGTRGSRSGPSGNAAPRHTCAVCLLVRRVVGTVGRHPLEQWIARSGDDLPRRIGTRRHAARRRARLGLRFRRLGCDVRRRPGGCSRFALAPLRRCGGRSAGRLGVADREVADVRGTRPRARRDEDHERPRGGGCNSDHGVPSLSMPRFKAW